MSEAGYKKIIKIGISIQIYVMILTILFPSLFWFWRFNCHRILAICFCIIHVTHMIKRELAYFVNCRYGHQNGFFVKSRHFKNTIKPLYIWLYMPQKNSEIKAVTNGRYELNKLTSLPMGGFIVQLVEHRTGIAEVTGLNPVEALIFPGFFFPIA